MVDQGRKLKVAVLMGGFSSERNVSLSTGKQILEKLDKDKYEVIGVDAAKIMGSSRAMLAGAGSEVEAVSEAGKALMESQALVSMKDIAESDNPSRPDVALIALHGKYGEDGTIQGMLELLGIPYTGSGVLASSLAMDKSMAKKVLAADGIIVPQSVDFICRNGAWPADKVQKEVARMGYPVIVKPSRQGSTIGMTKVITPEGLNDAIKRAADYDEQIIVEQFVVGTELTVSVLGTDEPFALPVVEIIPEKGFYDYEAKYKPGATEEIVPARLSDEDTKKAQRIALAAHNSLGCRGVSRVDIIATAEEMYVLEINTIPGMTPTSLLPRAAAAAGISFEKLLDMLIGFALEEGDGR